MLLGARTAMWGGASGWKNPYVTDGLVAMWDVLASPPTASTWAATVGTGIDWALTGTTVDSDGGLQFEGSSSSYGELTAAQSAVAWSNTGTLEIVYKAMTPPSGNGGRGGVLLKTPSDCIVGLGSFSLGSMAGSNNIIGPAAYIGYDVGSFYCVSTIYDSGTLQRYYKDGVSVTASNSDNIGGSQTVTRLGNRTTAYPFHGNVYAVRFYNRIITASEIAANYVVDKARFNLT